MSIAVVYIARGFGAGAPAAKLFFESYIKNKPDISHTLYVVIKGWSDESDLEYIYKSCSAFNAKVIKLDDDGFDWGAYIRASKMLNEQWVCFLNSHSRPCSPKWLEILSEAANIPNVGAVGATGSWSTWAFRDPFWAINAMSVLQYPIRLPLQIYKHYKYGKNYLPFPNYHLRSNAFLIKRELFVEFCQTIQIPTTKADAHILESGRIGLSSYIRDAGLELRVCGSNGLSYKPSEWILSETFRTPNQPNLLVGDNQTYNYDVARLYSKQRLEYAAWGRCFS